MANFKIKKLPPIKLVDLLRKRKTNLKQFLLSYGIISYSILVQKCDKMGVSTPSEEEFKSVVNKNVSSPSEGVIILDPPDLLKESTGMKLDTDVIPNLQQEDEINQTLHPYNPNNIDSIIKKPLKKQKNHCNDTIIDESVFVTNVTENIFENIGPELGEAFISEDNLDSSISKLSSLKKAK